MDRPSDAAYTAVESPAAGMKLSGSFMSLLLAMVFLGGSVAALIGVATILVGWLRWREPPSWLLSNVVTYAWFPLLAGLAFHGLTRAAGGQYGQLYPVPPDPTTLKAVASATGGQFFD